MNAKLTAKETALMTAIAEGHFSFFDQGLVHGSGIWTECMTEEIVGSPVYKVSDTQRGVASVINSLGRKGLLITETNEDGAWTDLSPAGEIWVKAHNGELEPMTEEQVQDTVSTIVENSDIPFETSGTIDEDGTERWVEADGTEWSQVTFLDGSRITTRRRRVTQASGKQVWKIKRWAAEYEGAPEHNISSAQAQAAAKVGRYTRS